MAADLKLQLSIANLAGDNKVAQFDCRAMKGREAISELFRFEVSFLADPDIRGKTVVGKRGWLTMSALSEDGSASVTDSTSSPNETILSGMVLEFRVDQIMNEKSQYPCYVVLAPTLSALNYSQESAIFSVPKSVKESADQTKSKEKTVFIKALLSGEKDKSTTGGHQQIFLHNISSTVDDINIKLPENITKYNETDFAFFSRMIEHYGIFYYFTYVKSEMAVSSEGSNNVDTIQIGAANSDFISFSESGVAYDNTSTGATNIFNPCVLSFSQVQRPHAKSFLVRDYNEAAVGKDLLASVDVVDSSATVGKSGEDNVDKGIGSIVEYGDHFANMDEGAVFARIRAQELAWQASVFEGESTIMGLHAGMKFQIKGSTSLYLVVSVEHSAAISNDVGKDLGLAENERYRNRFVAIPSTLQFRPRRQTPRPVMAGVFNAVVAGTPKKRADLDATGNYHVTFQFDESDKDHAMGTAGPSNTSVRQIEPYASSGVDGVASGLHFPLVPKTEVLMAYVNGDPDRPIIVGAAFNSINQNLVNNTSSTVNRLRTAAGTLLEMDDGAVTIENEGKSNEKVTRGPRYLRMDIPASSANIATHGNYFRMGARADDEPTTGDGKVATSLTYTTSTVDVKSKNAYTETDGGLKDTKKGKGDNSEQSAKTGTKSTFEGSGEGMQFYTTDDLDMNILGAGLVKFGKGYTTQTASGDSTHTVPQGRYVLEATNGVSIKGGNGAQPADIVLEASNAISQKSNGPTSVFTYGVFTKYTMGESFSIFLGLEQTFKAAMSITLQMAGATTVTYGVNSSVTSGLKADVIIGQSLKYIQGGGDMKISSSDMKILELSDLKIAQSDSKYLTGEDFKVCSMNTSIVFTDIKKENVSSKKKELESHVNELSIGSSKVKAISTRMENRFTKLTSII
ncbi:type VI secretion system Vgr family protein [Xanthobacter sediminis]